jgi:hypothetical protein
MNEKEKSGFLGTYFDKDQILRIVTAARWLSWAIVAIYALDLIVQIIVYALQFVRGFMVGVGVTDVMMNVLYILERPLRGVVYFVVLQAAAGLALIFMDIEDNTRRSARQK